MGSSGSRDLTSSSRRHQYRKEAVRRKTHMCMFIGGRGYSRELRCKRQEGGFEGGRLLGNFVVDHFSREHQRPDQGVVS